MSHEQVMEDLKNAADWLRGPSFVSQIERALERAAVQAQSPWCDRAAAAAYAHCSVSELDRAADAGAFKRYLRSGTPMFRKDEIDAAIAKGLWPKRKNPNQ